MTHVLIPGFGFRASMWEWVMAATDQDCLALEIPSRKSWSETVRTLAEMGGDGTYVGYSMGGRLALGVALEFPHLVERLILVSAGPGLAGPAEREARTISDQRWVSLLAQEGVDVFLDQWLAQPMFRGLGGRGRQHRIEEAENIIRQVEVLGQGEMPPYRDRLAELAMPVELVAGQEDEKYRRLAGEMAAAVGRGAAVHEIEDCGHAIPLVRPEALADLL